MTDALKMAREALARIERWDEELPATGKTWPGGMPMSYSAAYGSNGVRDYMRGIARAAIAAIDAQAPQAAPAREPNSDEVICPACTHQFRAIPINVQRLLLDSGHEPPFTTAPPQQAAPVALKPLTETEVEFGLNNELEDPSDDEAAGFHRGVRWAEAQHGIGAAAPAPVALTDEQIDAIGERLVASRNAALVRWPLRSAFREVARVVLAAAGAAAQGGEHHA